MYPALTRPPRPTITATSRPTPASWPRLPLSTARHGTISDPQDSDYFKFAVEAGHTYAFVLNNVPQGSHVRNGLLSLHGTTGNAGADAALRFHGDGYGTRYGVLTASHTGDYYLAVNAYSLVAGKPADYTLTVKEFAQDDAGN